MTVPTTTALCSDDVQTNRLPPDPSKSNVSMEVCLILDGGSQMSYLSERAIDRLKLEPTSLQSLSIATFGSSSRSKRVCPIVNVGVCLRGYPSMPLSLYVMSTIREPLVGQPISMCVSQHAHLLGLELADSSDNALNMLIDMLVGSNYYW